MLVITWSQFVFGRGTYEFREAISMLALHSANFDPVEMARDKASRHIELAIAESRK